MEDLLASAAIDKATYPLWVLFNVELLKQTGDFRKSLPVDRDLDGEAFAPVFTDKDLAKRLIDENPLWATCELMPIENIRRLCHILKLYSQGGVKNVGTDFSSRQFGESEKRHGQLRTIEIFLGEHDPGGP